MSRELSAPESLSPPPAPDMAGISFAEFLQILRRRKAVIIQTFVLITLVAVAFTLMSKPVYRASARLLVEPPSMSLNTVDTANPLSSILAMAPPQPVSTQVQALQSPELVRRVLKAVGPAELTVKQVEDTNEIEATAESTSRETAATAANTLLRFYIDEDVDNQLGEIRSAEAFVRSQQAASQKRLQKAAARLETFKQSNRIADLETDRTAQIQRVAALTDQLQGVQADLAAVRAQIATSQGQYAQQPATKVAEVQTTNAAIALLKQKLADLQLQREGLTQDGGYTDQAPQVIALDAQIKGLQKQIAAQPALTRTETISANERQDQLQSQMQNLAAQEAALQAQVNRKTLALAAAQGKIGHYSAWEIKLAQLMRDYNDAAGQNKMFSDKLADLSLREKAHHSTGRIDETALIPTVPVRPKKAYNITLGALFALFIGVCLALMQEFLDDRINTVEDAGRVLGLPALGHVPELSATDARLLPQMKGMDPAAESYRLLRTNIQFASVDMPIRTLLVTSAGPGEGKTTTAANLAFAMALDGKKVILVDTDLRRPSLHKLLGLPATPGVTDVLLDRATLGDALLEHEELPGMMTLPAGSTPPNPSELLNSRRFRNLVDDMTEMADLVIFDSPPVTVSADAPILASQMDGTVIVVETGGTKKGSARHSLDLLRKARANVLGVMYNKMRAIHGESYYYYRYQYATPATGERAALNGAKNGARPLPLPLESHED